MEVLDEDLINTEVFYSWSVIMMYVDQCSKKLFNAGLCWFIGILASLPLTIEPMLAAFSNLFL